MTATSIEKDLKIKIQDQQSKLVTGVQFAVTVTADKKGAKSSTYEDKDKDGIIYINKIDAGKYTVELQEIEGYVLKTASIKAEVKNKIEYKKVDVAAEIKTESQVNTAVEDTAVNNVPEESTATDTLPLLDSKSNGSKVSKEDVANAPKAAKASANGSQEASFARVVKKVVTPPAGKSRPIRLHRLLRKKSLQFRSHRPQEKIRPIRLHRRNLRSLIRLQGLRMTRITQGTMAGRQIPMHPEMERVPVPMGIHQTGAKVTVL